MKVVIDESVSYALVEALRRDGYETIAIADAPTSGNKDKEVFDLACQVQAVLITRDYHFTNHVRISL